MKVLRNRGCIRPRNADRRRRSIPRRGTQRQWNLTLVEEPTVGLPLLLITRRWTGSGHVWIERRHRIAATRIAATTTATTTT